MADEKFSLGTFPSRIRKRANQMVKTIEQATRAGALAADRAAVMATPVDTGNARSNWRASVRVPKIVEEDNRSVGGEGPAARKALAQARVAVRGFKITDAAIFLTNGVKYIKRLDSGYSRKGGFMVAAALLAASRAIRARLAKGIFKDRKEGPTSG